MSDVVVTHDPGASQYVAHVGGEQAGYAAYELDEAQGLIVFTHTVVGEEHGGQGVGSALARFALDEVRAAGERRVVPQCPFIAGWIDKHPAYQDLVATT